MVICTYNDPDQARSILSLLILEWCNNNNKLNMSHFYPSIIAGLYPLGLLLGLSPQTIQGIQYCQWHKNGLKAISASCTHIIMCESSTIQDKFINLFIGFFVSPRSQIPSSELAVGQMERLIQTSHPFLSLTLPMMVTWLLSANSAIRNQELCGYGGGRETTLRIDNPIEYSIVFNLKEALINYCKM